MQTGKPNSKASLDEKSNSKAALDEKSNSKAALDEKSYGEYIIIYPQRTVNYSQRIVGGSNHIVMRFVKEKLLVFMPPECVNIVMELTKIISADRSWKYSEEFQKIDWITKKPRWIIKCRCEGCVLHKGECKEECYDGDDKRYEYVCSGCYIHQDPAKYICIVPNCRNTRMRDRDGCLEHHCGYPHKSFCSTHYEIKNPKYKAPSHFLEDNKI